MDWANHYLHRAGFTDVLLDLKDISDGNFLPKVIQAVGKFASISSTIDSRATLILTNMHGRMH